MVSSAVYVSSSCSTFLSALDIFSLFHFSHSSVYTVVSCCDLICITLNEIKFLLRYLLAIYMSSFLKYSFQIFLFVFLFYRLVILVVICELFISLLFYLDLWTTKIYLRYILLLIACFLIFWIVSLDNPNVH